MNEQLELSPTQEVSRIGMTRRHDHDTSIAAADRIQEHLSVLQEAVVTAFRVYGPMTARECERLNSFSRCGPSTVRKRISELYKAGKLVAVGRRDGMKVWGLMESKTNAELTGSKQPEKGTA